MNQLIVKASKPVYSLVIPLGLFFVPLGLWNLLLFLQDTGKKVPLILGLMLLVTFAAVMWLVFNGYRRSVRYFTSEGLMRNDGRQFAWSELNRVVKQVRYKDSPTKRRLWRIEIQFRDGSSAWLLPFKVQNLREVMDFMDRLPCEHTEVEAG